MNINQLKIFYYTAKYGSLSIAADALYITQPAVSKGIQRLEEYYEIKFFNRAGKKLVLTDAGAALYDMAEKLFEVESQAEEIIRDFQQRKRGNLRIHASETFGAYYLPSIIREFKKNNPEIQVSVNILPTELVVEKTATLNNDVGFISYPVEHKKIITREILEDSLILIVPHDHEFSTKNEIYPHDLEHQFLIVHEKGAATRKITDSYIEMNNISVSVPLELSSNEAIKHAVEQGLGIAFVSRLVANEEIKQGRLKAVPLSDKSIKRKFYIIHHRDKYISTSLGNLIEETVRWASENF
ncbi:MAG: LysR family transcriptional regulator [Deltaproteobacteria bacterium]|nr:LysR family transcriptional regulator [Deltaproteobacteria bacterium]